VKTALKGHRLIIRPEYTGKRKTKREIGASPTYNKENKKIGNDSTNPTNGPIYSPIYNPINSARMKRQRSDANRVFYANNPGFGGVLLSEVALDELAGNFYTTFPIPLLNGLTLQDAMISQTFLVYIGIKVHSLIHLFTSYSLRHNHATSQRRGFEMANSKRCQY
jgi:hypothetical protein